LLGNSAQVPVTGIFHAHDRKESIQLHLLEQLVALERREEQRELAFLPAFGETLEEKQGAKEGVVHMRAMAQIYVVGPEKVPNP
jgi:hypothetical protein